MADVLVTGGTGYIGGVLVRSLVEQGQKVRVLLRPWSSRAALAGLDVEESIGDLGDPGSLVQAVKGVRRVFHLGATVRLDPFAAGKMRQINVAGTAALAAAAREAGVERLVHVSSVAAIGLGPREKPSDEAHVFDAAGYGPYFTTKHEAEEAVQAEVARGLDAVIVNPGNVVGRAAVPGGYAPIIRMAARGNPFYAPGAACYVPVGDVALGCRLAMERGRRGERYILAGDCLTHREILSMIAEVAGRKPPRWPLPEGPVLAAARIGDVLGKRWPAAFGFLNRTSARLLFHDFCASSAKAERELGWRWGSVREAIATEVAALS